MYSASFLSLINDSHQLGKVTKGFEQAIWASFRTNRVAQQTTAEIKHRFQKCEKIYGILRRDCQWGLDRIIDHLPEYLRAELDGSDWEPNKRHCWMAGDGA